MRHRMERDLSVVAKGVFVDEPRPLWRRLRPYGEDYKISDNVSQILGLPELRIAHLSGGTFSQCVQTELITDSLVQTTEDSALATVNLRMREVN